jgi:hypothetical protein
MVVEMDIKKMLAKMAEVGYGRRKDQCGWFTDHVKPDDLKIPVRDLHQCIGRPLAGVVAVQRGTNPGYDASSIFIRGVSAFASSHVAVTGGRWCARSFYQQYRSKTLKASPF